MFRLCTTRTVRSSTLLLPWRRAKAKEFHEVSRQFRKRSRELHPDKNPDRKDAQERYSLLSVIAEILRDDDKRKKYHHYYVNGVPTWRGTGYFYTRFRPGLGTVLAILGFITCLAQYIAQTVTHRLEVKRINNFRQAAIRIAYGNKPTDVRKKVRVPLSAGSTGATEEMGRKAVNGSNGRLLDMVVKNQNVWLLSDGSEFPLDQSTAPAPRFTRTWIPALVMLLVSKVLPQSGGEAASPPNTSQANNASEKSKRKNK